MKNRAGTLVSNLSGDAEYKSFLPNPLPPEVVELDNEAEKLLIQYLIIKNERKLIHRSFFLENIIGNTINVLLKMYILFYKPNQLFLIFIRRSDVFANFVIGGDCLLVRL